MSSIRKQQGFTLVEALVALAVLSIAIVPAYAISASSVDLAFSIKNNVIASNLSQEGLEVIRAIRDDNWFNERPWDTGLLSNCATGCRVQWDSTAILPLDDNPVLSVDSLNGKYFYALVGIDATPSVFRRRISINIISATQLKIESEVTWEERGRSKSVKTESHLLDWK